MEEKMSFMDRWGGFLCMLVLIPVVLGGLGGYFGYTYYQNWQQIRSEDKALANLLFLDSSAPLSQTINPLLLEVDLDEGWQKVRTVGEKEGNFRLWQKEGSDRNLFVMREVIVPENMSVKEAHERNARNKTWVEFSYLYRGYKLPSGNICRITEDGAVTAYLLVPK